MKIKIILFYYGYKTDNSEKQWVSILFLIIFYRLREFFISTYSNLAKKKMKSFKRAFTVPKLEHYEKKNNPVKIRCTLDNQASELLCQNSIIHEGSRASPRHCVTTAIVLTCVPKIVSSNSTFLGPIDYRLFKTFSSPWIIG